MVNNRHAREGDTRDRGLVLVSRVKVGPVRFQRPLGVPVGIAIFMTPMIVGVILGAKARRLGDRLGTVGMWVDGSILALGVLYVLGMSAP